MNLIISIIESLLFTLAYKLGMVDQENCRCFDSLMQARSGYVVVNANCGSHARLLRIMIALVATNCHIWLHPFAYCNFSAVATSKQQAQDTDHACTNNIESHMM